MTITYQAYKWFSAAATNTYNFLHSIIPKTTQEPIFSPPPQAVIADTIPILIYIILPLIFIGVFAYIKIQYPFWSRQPVYHTYDFWRGTGTSAAYIIDDHKAPIAKTKYYDAATTKTIPIAELTDDDFAILILFLHNHYLHNTNTTFFTITREQLYNNLTGGINGSNVSFYKPQTATTIYGVMASKSTTLYIFGNEFSAYFWNYITIHKGFENNPEHSRKMIQTHEYNTRICNGNPSIFIKEPHLCSGVVPLTVFTTHIFNRSILKRVPKLYSPLMVVKITEKNVILYSRFFELFATATADDDAPTKKIGFSFMALNSTENILAMIKTKQLFIYCLKLKEDILAFYILKNPFLILENAMPQSTQKTAAIPTTNVIECVSSICNMDITAATAAAENKHIFYSAFLHSLHQCCVELQINIELFKITNMAHNRWLIAEILATAAASGGQSTQTSTSTSSGIYLYNLCVPSSPFAPENVFMLEI